MSNPPISPKSFRSLPSPPSPPSSPSPFQHNDTYTADNYEDMENEAVSLDGTKNNKSKKNVKESVKGRDGKNLCN
jgi:hypothetical protein